MSEHLDYHVTLAAWLAVSYVKADDNQKILTLKEIHKECIVFYGNKCQQQCPPCRETVGKVIQKIFCLKSCFIYENSVKKTAYRNLKPRNDATQDHTNISVPDYCRTSYIIQCPLPIVINGQQEYCEVHFEKDDTWLSIQNTNIKCGFQLEVNQRNIDGMLQVVNHIRICEGIPDQNDFSFKAFTKENINTPYDNKSSSTLRSKSCKMVLNWFTKSNICRTCVDLQSKRKLKKRHYEDENSTTHVPVIKKVCIDETSGSKKIKLSENDHDDMKKILELVLKSDHNYPIAKKD